MTRLERAKKRGIPEELRKAARREGVGADYLKQGIARGEIVLLKNRNHRTVQPLAIGKGLKTKINANIGTSKDHLDLKEELKKMKVAIEYGADTIMDLSTGGDLDKIRKAVLKESRVPVGTVPIYQAAVEAVKKRKSIVEMDVEEIFAVIERQVEDGVDFITVHCGLTRESARRLKQEGRLLDIVSRGGAFTVEWMAYNKRENPLFEYYDRLLEIARGNDVVLSLGDGMRPGCLADATDRGQIQELIILGELAQRACAQGIQVMIEGPGHVPINQIETNVKLEKHLCHGAPFYVLGPLVTDIAPGYDHITSAIGGALAGAYGADYLCYVTPSEHLRLPTIEDVREGVIAARIAAHAADIAKGVKGALEQDIKMARARKKMDWESQFTLSLDPEKSKELRKSRRPEDRKVCTMCGEFCAIKLLSDEEKWNF
jgi:phosphomethylpyrimidine synthase